MADAILASDRITQVIHRTSIGGSGEGIGCSRWVSASGLIAGLLGVGFLGMSLVLPASTFGEEPVGNGKTAIEISCGESQDDWQRIVTLGPVDAADEEESLSELIQVTLKYLFLQGSQQMRLTLLTKRTQNAKVALEINPKQLCDSQGLIGIRTTISGQTQTLEPNESLDPGYIQILPEQLN